MQLYFLRHGIAVDHGAPGYEEDDDARPLTEKGIKVTKGVARGLAKLVTPDIILTSPLPRAQQTAEIVGKRLGAPVIVTDLLGLSFDGERLGEALRQAAASLDPSATLERVMLVGHEPSFSQTVGALTGAGLALTFKKAGLVRVDVTDTSLGGGTLQWVLTPGHLRRIGRT